MLVVNDGARERVAIVAMLAPLGVVVVQASSGREALREVLRQSFALILMDVRMPGMDGYETANLIRRRPQSMRTPIIFLTAFGAEDNRESLIAYASGAIDFIVTPVPADVLRAKVSAFVDLFLQAEELRRSLDSITTLNVALRESDESTRAVLDTMVDGIITVDAGGLIESLNALALALFGYREEEAVGQPLSLIIAPERRDAFRDLAAPQRRLTEIGAQSRPLETVGRRQDGSTFAMEVAQGEIKRDGRSVTLAFVRDVSERKAYTESLEHQALHDELTGLANRTLFGEHLLQALASAGRSHESRAVLMLDLDGFKNVNDTLGHDRGDLVLNQVGRRLRAALRGTDTIARFGGDEFAVLPGGATDLPAAAAVAWKIQEACGAGFTVDREVAHVSCSVGIAMFPEHGTSAGELLRRADAAMYVAKRSRRGHAIFDASQEMHSARELALLLDLRHCVDRGQLVLHYQPKFDLATREVSGVEALVRWQHPTRGLLGPNSFMPEAERTRMIEPVTNWVLGEALRQHRRWHDDGVDLTIAVNISAHSLGASSNLPDIVAELTAAWGTNPARLILEVSESALIEASAPEILARLAAMGERVSIDDFGTGYSSLSHLRRRPVSEIKIDQSFITNLSADSEDAVIVHSTIDLAHNLGLTVVAEGVEDERAIDLLVGYGCDSAQGYLLGRPGAADSLNALLH